MISKGDEIWQFFSEEHEAPNGRKRQQSRARLSEKKSLFSVSEQCNRSLQSSLTFWLYNSVDDTHGGYFNCLAQDGHVFDTVKYVKVQASQLYTFSQMLLSNSEYFRSEINRGCIQGGDFLVKHCISERGPYYSVTEDGKPLDVDKCQCEDGKPPKDGEYISETELNCVLALLVYSCVCSREEIFTLAWREFEEISKHVRHCRLFDDTHPVKNSVQYFPIDVPLNVLSVIDQFWTLRPDTRDMWQDLARNCIQDILEHFDEENGCLRENVLPNGAKDNESHWGRKIMPERAFSCTHILLQFAKNWPGYLSDEIYKECERIVEWCFTNAWHANGGFFTVVDVKPLYPRVEVDSRLKLWKTHAQALACLSSLIEFSQSESERDRWTERLITLWTYCKDNFEDPAHGGWFHSLDSNNDVLMNFKGGPTKGFREVGLSLLATKTSLGNYFKSKHSFYSFYFCNVKRSRVKNLKIELAESMSKALGVPISEITMCMDQQGPHVIVKFYFTPSRKISTLLQDADFPKRFYALMKQNDKITRLLPDEEQRDVVLYLRDVEEEVVDAKFDKVLAKMIGMPLSMVEIVNSLLVPDGVVVSVQTPVPISRDAESMEKMQEDLRKHQGFETCTISQTLTHRLDFPFLEPEFVSSVKPELINAFCSLTGISADLVKASTTTVENEIQHRRISVVVDERTEIVYEVDASAISTDVADILIDHEELFNILLKKELWKQPQLFKFLKSVKYILDLPVWICGVKSAKSLDTDNLEECFARKVMGVKSHDVALKIEEQDPHLKCIFIVRRTAALDFRLKSPDNILNDWQNLFFANLAKMKDTNIPAQTQQKTLMFAKNLRSSESKAMNSMNTLLAKSVGVPDPLLSTRCDPKLMTPKGAIVEIRHPSLVEFSSKSFDTFADLAEEDENLDSNLELLLYYPHAVMFYPIPPQELQGVKKSLRRGFRKTCGDGKLHIKIDSITSVGGNLTKLNYAIKTSDCTEDLLATILKEDFNDKLRRELCFQPPIIELLKETGKFGDFEHTLCGTTIEDINDGDLGEFIHFTLALILGVVPNQMEMKMFQEDDNVRCEFIIEGNDDVLDALQDQKRIQKLLRDELGKSESFMARIPDQSFINYPVILGGAKYEDVDSHKMLIESSLAGGLNLSPSLFEISKIVQLPNESLITISFPKPVELTDEILEDVVEGLQEFPVFKKVFIADRITMGAHISGLSTMDLDAYREDLLEAFSQTSHTPYDGLDVKEKMPSVEIKVSSPSEDAVKALPKLNIQDENNKSIASTFSWETASTELASPTSPKGGADFPSPGRRMPVAAEKTASYLNLCRLREDILQKRLARINKGLQSQDAVMSICLSNAESLIVKINHPKETSIEEVYKSLVTQLGEMSQMVDFDPVCVVKEVLYNTSEADAEKVLPFMQDNLQNMLDIEDEDVISHLSQNGPNVLATFYILNANPQLSKLCASGNATKSTHQANEADDRITDVIPVPEMKSSTIPLQNVPRSNQFGPIRDAIAQLVAVPKDLLNMKVIPTDSGVDVIYNHPADMELSDAMVDGVLWSLRENVGYADVISPRKGEKSYLCLKGFSAEQVEVAQGHLTIALAESMDVSSKKVMINEIKNTDDGCIVVYERPALVSEENDKILQRLARTLKNYPVFKDVYFESAVELKNVDIRDLAEHMEEIHKIFKTVLGDDAEITDILPAESGASVRYSHNTDMILGDEELAKVRELILKAAPQIGETLTITELVVAPKIPRALIWRVKEQGHFAALSPTSQRSALLRERSLDRWTSDALRDYSEEISSQIKSLTKSNLLAGTEVVAIDVEFSINPQMITDHIAEKLNDPEFQNTFLKELLKNTAVLEKMLMYGGYGEVEIILCGTTEDEVETIEDDLIRHLAEMLGVPVEDITIIIDQEDDHVIVKYLLKNGDSEDLEERADELRNRIIEDENIRSVIPDQRHKASGIVIDNTSKIEVLQKAEDLFTVLSDALNVPEQLMEISAVLEKKNGAVVQFSHPTADGSLLDKNVQKMLRGDFENCIVNDTLPYNLPIIPLDKKTVLSIDDTEKERSMKETLKQIFCEATGCQMQEVLVTEFRPLKDRGSYANFVVPARHLTQDMINNIEAESLSGDLLKAAYSRPEILDVLKDYDCVDVVECPFFFTTVKELSELEDEVKTAFDGVPAEDIVVLLERDGEHVIATFVIPKSSLETPIDRAELREKLSSVVADKINGNQVMKEFGVLIQSDNYADIDPPVITNAMAESLELPKQCVELSDNVLAVSEGTIYVAKCPEDTPVTKPSKDAFAMKIRDTIPGAKVLNEATYPILLPIKNSEKLEGDEVKEDLKTAFANALGVKDPSAIDVDSIWGSDNGSSIVFAFPPDILNSELVGKIKDKTVDDAFLKEALAQPTLSDLLVECELPMEKDCLLLAGAEAAAIHDHKDDIHDALTKALNIPKKLVDITSMVDLPSGTLIHACHPEIIQMTDDVVLNAVDALKALDGLEHLERRTSLEHTFLVPDIEAGFLEHMNQEFTEVVACALAHANMIDAEILPEDMVPFNDCFYPCKPEVDKVKMVRSNSILDGAELQFAIEIDSVNEPAGKLMADGKFDDLLFNEAMKHPSLSKLLEEVNLAQKESFTLFGTNLEKAKEAGVPLEDAIAKAAGLDPHQIAIVPRSSTNNTQCDVWINTNGKESPENFQEPFTKIRDRIADNPIIKERLPDQRVEKNSMIIRNLDDVASKKEQLAASLEAVARAPVSIDNIVEGENATVVEYTKPRIFAMAKDDIADELRKYPGFRDAEIEDAAVFDFPLFGMSKDKAEEVSDKLRAKAAELLGVPEESVSVLMSEQDDNTICKFVIKNPPETTKKMCAAPENLVEQLQKLIAEDDELNSTVPNQDKAPAAISLKGVSLGSIENNTEDLIEALTMACHSPVELIGFQETDDGVFVEYMKPNSAKPNAHALQQTFQRSAALKDADFAEPAMTNITVFATSPEVLEPKTADLCKIMADSLDVLQDGISVFVEPQGKANSNLKYAVDHPDEDVRWKVENSKDLKETIRKAIGDLGDIADQSYAPTTMFMYPMDLLVASDNKAKLLEAISEAADVPPSDCEFLEIFETPKGVCVSLQKPVAKAINYIDLEPMDGVKTCNASLVSVTLYNRTVADVMEIKDKLLTVTTDILQLEDPDTISVHLSPVGAHVNARCVVQNPSHDARVICKDSKTPDRIRAALGASDQGRNSDMLVLNNVTPEDLKENESELKRALAALYGVPPSDICIDDIVETADGGVMVQFTKPAVAKKDPSKLPAFEESLSACPGLEKVTLPESEESEIVLFGVSPKEVEAMEDRLRNLIASELGMDPESVKLLTEEAGGNTKLRVVLLNPDEVAKLKLDQDFPTKVRNAIDADSEILLPDQSFHRASCCLLDLSFAEMFDATDETCNHLTSAFAKMHNLPEDTMTVAESFPTSKGFAVILSKPKACEMDYAKLSEEMEVKVVEAACTEAVIYDIDMEKLEDKEDKVTEAVGQILSANPDSVGVGWAQDEKHAIGNFAILNPNKDTKEFCSNHDNISVELRKLLKDIVPDQSRDSKSLFLQNVDAKAVNDNIDEIKEALARALGVPASEIDIKSITETGKGTAIEFEKPSSTNLPEDNWKLAEDLKQTPGLENIEVPTTLVCPVILFETSPEVVQENAEPLCEKLAEFIRNSPDKTSLVIEPSGENALAKFILSDPDTGVKFEVDSGTVPNDFREAISQDEALSKIFPNQNDQPGAISIKGLPFEKATKRTAAIQDNLCKACGCLDSDIDITQIIDLDGSTVVCYTKPCKGSLTEEERDAMGKGLSNVDFDDDGMGGAAVPDESDDEANASAAAMDVKADPTKAPTVYEVTDAAIWDFLIYNAFVDDVEPIQENIREKLTKLLGVKSENVGMLLMQGEEDDHVTVRFAISEPDEIVKEQLNNELAQKLRELIINDESLEGMPSQELNNGMICFLNIDKAGLEPLMDEVREAIAKALAIPPGDVKILSLSDTSQGALIEFTKPLASAIDVELIEDDIHHLKEFEEVALADIGKVEVLLYGLSPKDVTKNDERFCYIMSQLLDILPNQISVSPTPIGSNTNAEFVIIYPDDDTLAKCASGDVPPQFRHAIDYAHDLHLPDQRMESASMFIKGADLATLDKEELKKILAQSLGVTPSTIEIGDMFETDDGLVLNYTKPKSTVNDTDSFLKELSEGPSKATGVNDVAICDVVLYHTSKDAVYPVGALMKTKAAEILGVSEDDISIAFVEDEDNVIVKIVVNNPSKEVREGCKTLAPKLRAIVASDPALSDLLPDQTKDMGCILLKSDTQSVKNNKEALIAAVAKACGVPPSEINITDISETSTGVVVSFEKPKCTVLDKDDLTSALKNVGDGFETSEEVAIVEVTLYDVSRRKAKKKEKQMGKIMAKLFEMEPENIIVDLLADKPDTRAIFILLNPKGKQKALANSGEILYKFRMMLNSDLDVRRSFPDQIGESSAVCINGVDIDLLKDPSNQSAMRHFLAQAATIPRNKIDIAKIWDTDGGLIVQFVHPSRVHFTEDQKGVFATSVQKIDGFQDCIITDAAIITGFMLHVTKPRNDTAELLQTSFAHVFDIEPEDILVETNRIRKTDCEVTFVISNGSPEIQNHWRTENGPEKIRRQLAWNKLAQKTIPNQTRMKSAVILDPSPSLDIVDESLMLSSICKARKVPYDQIQITSISDSHKGVVVEYQHSKALPVHNKKELEFNVRKALGLGDITVHEGAVVDLLLYGKSTKEAKRSLPKLKDLFCKLFKLKSEAVAVLLGNSYRDSIKVKFIVMNDSKTRVDDFASRMRENLVLEEIMDDQELSSAMICIKNVNPDLMFETASEIHHSLRLCHEGLADIQFTEDNINVTPNRVFVGMKKSTTVDVVNNLQSIISKNIGYQDAQVLDACECRISIDPSYIADKEDFTKKLKKIVTSLIALPPKDITVKFLGKQGSRPERMRSAKDLNEEAEKSPSNTDIRIFLVDPTKTMKEECSSGELAKKIIDELKPAMKTEYVTLKGASIADLEKNPEAVVEALEKASNLAPGSIDLRRITESGSDVIVAFKHPETDQFSKEFDSNLPDALAEKTGIAVKTHSTAKSDFTLYNTSAEEAEKVVDLLVKALAQILQVPPDKISATIQENGDHSTIVFYIDHPTHDVKTMCATDEPEEKLRNYIKFDPAMKEMQIPDQTLTPTALQLDGIPKDKALRNKDQLAEAIALALGVPKILIASIEETPEGVIIFFKRPSQIPFEAAEHAMLVSKLSTTPLSNAKIIMCSVFDFVVFGKSSTDLKPYENKFLSVFNDTVAPKNPTFSTFKDDDGKTFLRFCIIDEISDVEGPQIRAAFFQDPELRELLTSHFVDYTIPLTGVDAEVIKVYLGEMIPHIANTFQVTPDEVQNLSCEATDSGCVVTFRIPKTESTPPRDLLVPALFGSHPKMFALINKKSADTITTTLSFKGVDHAKLAGFEDEFRNAICKVLDIKDELLDLTLAKEGDSTNVTFTFKRSPATSKRFETFNSEINDHLKAQPNIGKILFPPKTFSTSMAIPNASAEDLQSNLEALKAAMALALGVDKDQIQDVSLSQGENGVVVKFTINQGENGENLQKMRDPNFNFMEAAKQTPELGVMWKKKVPNVSLQIALQNVNSDDIDLEQLKDQLAVALGAGFKASEVEIKMDKTDNGVIITLIFPQSEEAVKLLQDPTFDLKKELAKNPQLKFFGNMSRFSYPFPVLKPKDLTPLQSEIEKAIAAVTKSPLDTVSVQKMEGDYTGSNLSFGILDMSDTSKKIIQSRDFPNLLFKQLWLYPGLYDALLTNHVISDFHFLLANATEEQARKVEKALLYVLVEALGIKTDDVAVKYEPFGDHMIVKFVFKFSKATQKILEDNDLARDMLNVVLQPEFQTLLPSQERAITSIVLVGVLMSEIEEDQRELLKRFSQAALLPVGLIELQEMKEVSEGTIVSLRHPKMCPFDSDVLDGITLAIRGSKKFSNDQVDIEARPHAQYSFLFKKVPPEEIQSLAPDLCTAFALALGVDPQMISIEMLQGKDGGSEIIFGIKAGCLNDTHILLLSDTDAFNEDIALQFEQQDAIAALLKKLGLIGSTLTMQIFFNINSLKDLEPYHQQLIDVFAVVAGVTSDDVEIEEKEKASEAEETVQSVDDGINMLLSSISFMEDPQSLTFNVADTAASRDALKDPEEFDRKFKEQLGLTDPLGKMLGLTQSYISKDATFNKVSPAKIKPFEKKICVSIASLADVDPEKVRIIDFIENDSNTGMNFEVIENPRSVASLNSPDFSAKLMELLAKIQGLNELLGLVWQEPEKFTSGGHGSGSCANLAKKLDNSDSCFAIVHMRVAPEKDQSNFRVVPIMVRFEGKSASDVSKERCRYLFNDAKSTFGDISGVLDIQTTKKCSSAHIMNSFPDLFDKNEVDIDSSKGKKKKRKRTRGALGAMKAGTPRPAESETDSRVKEILKILRSDIGWVNWALFKCSGKKLELASRDSFGSGTIFAMKEFLKNKEVYFGLLRMSFGTQPYRRSWIVMFHWTGPGVGVVKRGKLNSKKGAMEDMLRPFNATVTLNHKDDVTVENILTRCRNIFVVDGDDDDVADASNADMMAQFQAALEEEEKLNANVEKVLDVDKEEDDLSIDEVLKSIRNREDPTNWLVLHPIPEYRRYSRAVSRSASLANTPRRTPRTASSRKFNFVG